MNDSLPRPERSHELGSHAGAAGITATGKGAMIDYRSQEHRSDIDYGTALCSAVVKVYLAKTKSPENP